MQNMSPEQAIALLQFQIHDYEFEIPTTRAVLLATPDSGADYRPDSKSRTARELVFHIAGTEKWFLDSLAAGQFLSEESSMPQADLKTHADLVNWWERETASGLEKVKKLDAQQAAKVLDFFGAFHLPTAVFMGWLTKHTIHHRGQLAAYIRAAGGSVPSIYGGSADEPWKP
jgi:uncharacterized damage-inducible protein DinB